LYLLSPGYLCYAASAITVTDYMVHILQVFRLYHSLAQNVPWRRYCFLTVKTERTHFISSSSSGVERRRQPWCVLERSHSVTL